jgi:hypothetical protein
MAHKKGAPKTPGSGRKKGSVNKATALLKDAVLLAATKAGQNIDAKSNDALVTYLANQAEVNPGPFMTLLGKVLPMQIAGDAEEPINIQINFT